MNKKVGISTAIGTAAVIIIVGAVLTLNLPTDQKSEFSDVYAELNSELKKILKENNISLSSPLRLSEKESILKYCAFFDDEEKQSLIDYCTSTELKDSEGKFLGNIHMVGDTTSPKLILAIMQVDPLMSKLGDLKIVYGAAIEYLVCDCWQEQKPDGFETISDWIDAMKEFHASDVKPHSRTKVIAVEDNKLQLELSTNQDGYLRKLLIER